MKANQKKKPFGPGWTAHTRIQQSLLKWINKPVR